MRLLVAALALVLAGCTAVPEAHPPESEYDVIVAERLDAVWRQSGLDDRARPDVASGPVVSQFEAGERFSECMAERGWPDYFVNENGTGFGYQSIDLTSSDAETLDWYECFAAYPVDAQFTMNSVEQFDFVYDYFQDTLIPCLAENGYALRRAPTRLEFRTILEGWTDPLFPYVWNPYYDIQFTGSVAELPVAKICPPTPPGQSFYEFR